MQGDFEAELAHTDRSISDFAHHSYNKGCLTDKEYKRLKDAIEKGMKSLEKRELSEETKKNQNKRRLSFGTKSLHIKKLRKLQRFM